MWNDWINGGAKINGELSVGMERWLKAEGLQLTSGIMMDIYGQALVESGLIRPDEAARK